MTVDDGSCWLYDGSWWFNDACCCDLSSWMKKHGNSRSRPGLAMLTVLLPPNSFPSIQRAYSAHTMVSMVNDDYQ